MSVKVELDRVAQHEVFPTGLDERVDRFESGDRLALARGLTCIERGGRPAESFLERVHGRAGRALRLGVTGPPGSGKSTVVSALIRSYRALGRTVGVVAVDPSSSFTGGALLGDRVRMQEFATDRGVFIRSMAARDRLGGLDHRVLRVGIVVESVPHPVLGLAASTRRFRLRV